MKLITLIVLVLAQSVILSPAQEKKSASATSASPAVKDPSLTEVADDPSLPRVLLIGDSISMGYTLPVRNLLKGKANVHRVPENGGPTTNGLAKLKLWLGDKKWDVIHFNFGLHDLKLITAGQRRIPVEAYEKNLGQLVRELEKTEAKLIWASTTPVPEPLGKLGRLAADVPIYNRAAAKVMADHRIVTDDLYSWALPQSSKIQRPENVHFNNAGYEGLAGQVAASIETALSKTK